MSLILRRLDLFLVSLTFLSSLETAQTCSFPETLSNVKHHWRIMSPDHTSSFRHFRRKVDFRGRDMRIEFILSKHHWRPAGRVITYRCMKHVDKDAYMVGMFEKDQFMHYTCVKFIFRSLNVVQLKLGEKMYYKTDEVCREDRLTLMDAPLVYFYDQDTFWTEPRNENLKYRACPLDGGYVLSQWSENGRSMCKATPKAPVSVKLENECERGGGLGILGGSSDCPAVYTGYPLYCLGDWQDGKYTYMLLFRELMAFDLLCMRYPTKHGEQFTAHLFVDGVCDSTTNTSRSRSVRRMVLNRYKDPAADICSNDSPVCNEFIPPVQGCDRVWSSYCRYTCHTCPWRMPWRNVTLPEMYRGVFYKDTYSQGEEMVTITDRYIHMPSLGKYQLFGKSTCVNAKHSHGMGSNFNEYVYIQTFDNGCSPRLVIIQLASRTTSILSIRLSTSITVDWKLFDKLSKSPDPDYGSLACPTSNKFRSHPINLRETFRTMPHGWFNLVHIQQSTFIRDTCILPSYKHIRTIFATGVSCSGNILQTSDRTFRLTFKNCKSNGDVIAPVNLDEDAVDFECLSSFSAKVGRKKQAQMTDFIITKVLNYINPVFNETMHCWMYSTLQPNRLLLSRVSDCDQNSEVYFFEYGGRVKHYVGAVDQVLLPAGLSHATNLHSVRNIWCLVIGSYLSLFWTLHRDLV